MRTLYLTCLLLFVANCCYSAPVLADSLHAKLLVSGEDTNKVNILNKLVDYYFNINFDTALIYSIKAYEISNRIKYSNGLAVSGYQKGLASFYLGKYINALDCFSESISSYKK